MKVLLIMQFFLTELVLAQHFSNYRALESSSSRGQGGRALNVFPSDEVEPFDPINRQYYQKVAVGQTFRSNNPWSGYTHWRYITVYNVTEGVERIRKMPFYKEDCHDRAIVMATWEESYHINVTLTAAANATVLGIGVNVSASVQHGVRFAARRNIMGTAGIAAIHYPYKFSETWEGVTWKQTYDQRTGTVSYVENSSVYPKKFYLNNQNPGFIVKRVITKVCDEEGNEAKPSDQERILQGMGL